MIPAPTGWADLWADPASTLQLTVEIYLGIDNIYRKYTNDDIVSCSISGSLFDDLSIGNSCSTCMTLVIYGSAGDAAAFSRMQAIMIWGRLENSLRSTIAVHIGTYFINDVVVQDDNTIRITAYDFLYVLQTYDTHNEIQESSDTVSSYLTKVWQKFVFGSNTKSPNRTDFLNATFLDNSQIGASSNTVGNIRVYQSGAKNAREVIEAAAMLAGGNAAISKSNHLKLFRLDSGPTITTAPMGTKVTATTITKDDLPQVITGIELDNGTDIFTNSPGWRIAARNNEDITHLTSSKALAVSIANNMHSDMDVTYPKAASLRVSDVRVDGVFITPLAELGDIASVDIGNGKYYNFMICDFKLDYISGSWGYIGASKTGSSVQFSVDDEWNNATVAQSYCYLDILSNHVFRIRADEGIRLNISSLRYPKVAKVTEGMRPFDVTLTYISTEDNTSKSVSVTAYRLEDYYPVESNGNGMFDIKNMTFYTTSALPDDSIGALVSTRMQINDSSTGTSGARLTVQVSELQQ